MYYTFRCTAGPPVTQETTPPTSTTEELTTPSGFVCPSDGKFPYEGNCTVYWFCAGGEAIVIVIRQTESHIDF